MADLQRLVVSARAIKGRSDRSVGWKLAAIKAVEASGVRHKPDVSRLSREVYDELRKCGDMATGTGARRQSRRRSTYD
jgi:hypothetical protein